MSDSSGKKFASVSAPHLFDVDHADLSRLSAEEAVKAFRNLLWARATSRGIPTTRVSISSEIYTPDGGVDASILGEEDESIQDDLLTLGTRFQIKTGNFAPWQKSKVGSELFVKTKQPSFENLRSQVQATLKAHKRLVLVCFGEDPTDQQIRKARENYLNFFSECGYRNASVEVWGQTQLIGLFRAYPSLCLHLRGHSSHGFRSRNSWSMDEDMRPKTHYSPEQQQLVDDLRGDLRTNRFSHLRLIGIPGIGKTRLALEITSADDLAPLTLYVRDGESLLQSSFINELVQPDDRRHVLFVIDECSNKDLAEIWNLLKSRSDRIRLITIDHNPDKTVDDKTRVFCVEKTETDQIVAILSDHNVNKHDASRWAAYCEGCPRVAHVLGENLFNNPDDLLAAPTTSQVWRRFVDGYDAPDSDEVKLRRIVIRFCALFERFGFEEPVQEEAGFIQVLALDCDSRLTRPQFNRIIQDLRNRRIIQGNTTLYITPRLLHLHLYREFWQNYGNSFDIEALLNDMPPRMRDWFVEMLCFAHDCPTAEKAIDTLLGHEGLFPSGEFPDSQRNGRIISMLAESYPQKTLRCLRRTVGKMDTASLSSINESKQWLVSALEKIAVWEDAFSQASELLLDLAEAENGSTGNYAKDVFVKLFSLIPGLCPTQAKPSQRNEALASALDSDSVEKRRLGLEACASALRRGLASRMVGSEHQGLRPTISFWVPKTHDELCDAYQNVWRLLDDRLTTWQGDDRKHLISTIIDSAWSVLPIRPLEDLVIRTIKSISSDQQTDLKALIEFVKSHQSAENLSEQTTHSLKAIDEHLNGHDFKSTLMRFVKHATGEDYHGDTATTTLAERKKTELIESVRANPHLLLAELPWLIREDSSTVHHFAYRIGQGDKNRLWLPNILEAYSTSQGSAETLFLRGYLRAIYEDAPEEWERVMLALSDNPATASRFSDYVLYSGMTNRIARQVIAQCTSGRQRKELLERWWLCQSITQLDDDIVQQLIVIQLDEDSEILWKNATHLCHAFYLENKNPKPLPEALAFRLLTAEAIADHRDLRSVSYYWSRIANAYIDQFPNRTWDLFGQLLRISRRGSLILEDLDANHENILTHLVRTEPEKAWACISKAYADARENGGWLSGHWLSSDRHDLFPDISAGPIQYIPAEILFDWVDDEPQERVYWLTRTLPKTLDQSGAGRLTRSFIARYGKSDSVRENLYRHFFAQSWCGKESDYFRKLREQTRTWAIDERNKLVRQWITDYAEMLDDAIKHAEIQEERGS